MDAPLLCLAMVRYHTFSQWICGLENIKFLLIVSAVASFILAGAVTLSAHHPHDTYWGKRFFAGLLPFVLCSAAALVELKRLNWNWRAYFKSLVEADFVYILLFGALLSAVATVIYTLKRREAFQLEVAATRQK